MGSSSFKRSWPLDIKDDTRYLFHPNGDKCSVIPRLWEYFHDALAYADRFQHRKEYIEAACANSCTTLEIAVEDFFQPPEVLEINLQFYRGRRGDRIQIRACDKVKVVEVGILILDDNGDLLEFGQAEFVEGDTWHYWAKKSLDVGAVTVIVDAFDLPGHVSESRACKTLRKNRSKNKKIKLGD
ncbi:hypothetical protein IJT10_00445 [bacterium]|nr:hypothetical protein [bacterium]